MGGPGSGGHEKYTPMMKDVIVNLIKAGCSKKKIAELCGIDRGTLYSWMARYGDLHVAVEKAYCVTEELLEAALLRSALGHSVPETKVFYDSKTGEVITHKMKKHFSPNPKAIEFALKNLNPDRWKERHEVEIGERDGTVNSLVEAQEVLLLDPTRIVEDDTEDAEYVEPDREDT